MTPDELRAALEAAPDVPDPRWLPEALARVAADPTVIGRIFAGVARRTGRAELPGAPGWGADQAARALLLVAVGAERIGDIVADLYRYGDAAEKLAILRALPLLPVGAAAVPLLHDAIRTNDTRLVAAALGPYAVHLDQPAWRQAVLKCVFMNIPLEAVHDLDARADAELGVMLDGLDRERTAAGRQLPADAAALLARLRAAGPDDRPTDGDRTDSDDRPREEA